MTESVQTHNVSEFMRKPVEQFIHKSGRAIARVAGPERLERGLQILRPYGPLVWISFAPLVTLAAVAVALGAATGWFWLFAVLTSVLVVAEQRTLIGANPARALARGFWELTTLILVGGVAIFWRLTPRESAALFALVYFPVSGGALALLYYQRTDQARIFKSLVALTLGPMLAAWILVSVLYGLDVGAQVFTTFRPHDHAPYEAVVAERDLRLENWTGPRVAVTLSGGGYRAALAHTGLLWAMDEAGIPIHILSTVSGGSIAGAAYSLGIEPQEFRAMMVRRKPGLPNDLVNFFPVMMSWVLPRYGSGETYVFHFWRTLFHDHTLGETGSAVLILNATDYATGERVAFWRGHAAENSLAVLVAASAAFPVAFDPVPLASARLMDGGVVENLGIEGLQRYLDTPSASGELPELPDIVLLSDMSAEPALGEIWNKPSVTEMATRAQAISYLELHERIFAQYLGGNYDRDRGDLEQPFPIAPDRFGRPDDDEGMVQAFVLAPTSPGERHWFGDESGDKAGLRVVDEVARIPTLAELTPDQVARAFWVGAKLASEYIPRVCALIGPSEPCRPVDPGPPPQ